MTDIRIEGLAELREILLRTLPDRLQGKALQAALAKAARPIVAQARAMAPKKTGRTERNIYSARSKFGQTRTYTSRIIGVRHGKKYQKGGKDAYYWKWNEFGRAAVVAGQKTRSRGGVSKSYTTDAKVLGTPATGFFGKQVRAVPARPFMRPAFEANKVKAAEIVRSSLAGEIQKVAARAAAKSRRALVRKVTGL